MKSLNIKYESALENAEIKDVAAFFELNQLFEYIDMLNWPDKFSYKPGCQFKIARSTGSLFIHFKVQESSIRALYTNDHDPVWEDSCVEFFCKLPEQNTYFNFEFNCIGTCLATEREDRNRNVNPLSIEKMNSIKRYASLGNSSFEEKKGPFEWKLTVEIPLYIIDIPNNRLPDVLMANFYKCGDGTSIPHYLSWSPVSTEIPDFHQPAYFGKIHF